jgi:tRNA(Ile)-lysidine synthase
MDFSLDAAIANVPDGTWAVGVSGGADSVALLSLLRHRKNLALHVVHLDHQTRGSESAIDAKFVEELSARWNLPCTIARLDQIELSDPPKNLSSRYRAARFALFAKVVKSQKLNGTILAHHADDQAETVLHRLVRGSHYAGLAAMSPRTILGELIVIRPLLGVRREKIRGYLSQQNIDWKEDASNQSSKFFRNQLRKLLAGHPQLVDELISLSSACAQLRNWSRSTAPVFEEQLNIAKLARLPKILASESARQWLIDRGVPAKQIESTTIERLIAMANDAATGARQDFPGGLHLRRRGGVIFVEKSDV